MKVFNSVVTLAHNLWTQLLNPEDWAIDATCGNGWDTLFLAKLLDKGKVFAIDLQDKAIEQTKALLKNEKYSNVAYFLGCHSHFPQEAANASIKLIVYNLGYLPGSDKKKKTLAETTLLSVANALTIIKPSGAISITCYPGHLEGKEEEERLLAFSKTLCKETWTVSYTQILNREKSPSLLFIQKSDRDNSSLSTEIPSASLQSAII